MKEEKYFWGNKIDILFSKKYLLNFFPNKKSSLVTKLNTLSRLIIYISFLLFIYSEKIIYIIAGILALLIIYYYFNTSDINNTNNNSNNNQIINVNRVPKLNEKRVPKVILNTTLIDKINNSCSNKINLNRQFCMSKINIDNDQNTFAEWLYK